MYSVGIFLLSFLLPLSVASFRASTKADEISFTFSRTWTLCLMILGVLFNMLSLFLPWGILTSSSTYVYLLGPIVNGEGVLLPEDLFLLMQVRGQLITVGNLIKATIIVGWTGVILDWYVERHVPSGLHRRVILYSVLLASSVLSFIAVVMFALTEINLYWGAYLALVGGVLMVLAVVMKELKVEVIVEREMSDQ